MMSNYTTPAVEIRYLKAEDVFLMASMDGPEGLYEDKWSDQTTGSFY